MRTEDFSLLSIGEMENRYNVTQRTMRFYEQKGLLKPRRLGNRRYYDAYSQEQLELILFGKRCGLSLDSIAVFLELEAAKDTNKFGVTQIRRLFLEHLVDQKSQLAQLRANIEESERFLSELQGQTMTPAQQTVSMNGDERSKSEAAL